MTSTTHTHRHVRPTQGFTLLELLVVVCIVVLLLGLSLPLLGVALESGRRAACAHNLKMLHLANQVYADTHGNFVAAASDIFAGNRSRWHGTRQSMSKGFDGHKGPLAPYLGHARIVRRCPSFKGYKKDSSRNAFEASCGGYGYNAIGVGSETYLKGNSREAMERGMKPDKIKNAGRTMMFSDCAFPQPYGNRPKYLIEYSFAEAYHWVFQAGVESTYRTDPSIHFRHRHYANVVWCDGHVSRERMETAAEQHFTQWDIGWFGEKDNALFDPF